MPEHTRHPIETSSLVDPARAAALHERGLTHTEDLLSRSRLGGFSWLRAVGLSAREAVALVAAADLLQCGRFSMAMAERLVEHGVWGTRGLAALPREQLDALMATAAEDGLIPEEAADDGAAWQREAERIASGGALHGVITDLEGPVAGARIHADHRVAVTDAGGRYWLPGIEPGERAVVTTAEGHLRNDRTLRVAAAAGLQGPAALSLPLQVGAEPEIDLDEARGDRILAPRPDTTIEFHDTDLASLPEGAPLRLQYRYQRSEEVRLLGLHRRQRGRVLDLDRIRVPASLVDEALPVGAVLRKRGEGLEATDETPLSVRLATWHPLAQDVTEDDGDEAAEPIEAAATASAGHGARGDEMRGRGRPTTIIQAWKVIQEPESDCDACASWAGSLYPKRIGDVDYPVPAAPHDHCKCTLVSIPVYTNMVEESCELSVTELGTFDELVPSTSSGPGGGNRFVNESLEDTEEALLYGRFVAPQGFLEQVAGEHGVEVGVPPGCPVISGSLPPPAPPHPENHSLVVDVLPWFSATLMFEARFREYDVVRIRVLKLYDGSEWRTPADTFRVLRYDGVTPVADHRPVSQPPPPPIVEPEPLEIDPSQLTESDREALEEMRRILELHGVLDAVLMYSVFAGMLNPKNALIKVTTTNWEQFADIFTLLDEAQLSTLQLVAEAQLFDAENDASEASEMRVQFWTQMLESLGGSP